MRILVVVILLASLVLSGCANTKVYTFKKDRVDQRAAGNKGYLMGNPPPAPVEGEVKQRTMFGLDIEIGTVKDTDADDASGETVVYEEEEVVIMEEAPAPQETTNFEPKNETSLPAEEEWIK